MKQSVVQILLTLSDEIQALGFNSQVFCNMSASVFALSMRAQSTAVNVWKCALHVAAEVWRFSHYPTNVCLERLIMSDINLVSSQKNEIVRHNISA
jgi:hypothetical protein